MFTGKRVLLFVAVTAVALVWAAPGEAQTFKLLSVDTTGCNTGNFRMTVVRQDLDGGTYNVRTVLTVGGLVYMNENAPVNTIGASSWGLFSTFSYGPVPNPGTWPVPQNKQMRIDWTLERPLGTVLHSWRGVIDSCNAGNILYSGPPAADSDGDFVPVPRDKCPSMRATTLNGCPARALTLAYDSASGRFVGWLVARGFPSLSHFRIVTIWKVRPGPDLRIGRVRTTARGNYSLRRQRQPGLYYSATAAVGNVVKETSPSLRLN